MKRFLLACVWFHLIATMVVMTYFAISLVWHEPTLYEPDSVFLAIMVYQGFQLIIDVVFIGKEGFK